MTKKKIILTDLMPKAGKDLLAYSGKDVLEKVGVDIIRNIIVSILCGENVRDLTEDLTKRRLHILNGALLTLFIRGANDIDGFIEKLPYLVKNQLKSKNAAVDKKILLLLLGLTGKGVQNILRNKKVEFDKYVDKLDISLKKAIEECKSSYGKLDGKLVLDGLEAQVDWKMVLSLLSGIGTQALAIRGAEKSMYGKLFERLVLGSCLSILGFRQINPTKDKSSEKVFWLSSRGEKRESDATLLYQPGKGVRFDIGFIGPGNTEISLDKVSRFERELEHGRSKYYMATFIIVDRIGERSRIETLAKKIEGTIIQMSMAFWPQVLAKRLGQVLGFRHKLQDMPTKEICQYFKDEMKKVRIEEFV